MVTAVSEEKHLMLMHHTRDIDANELKDAINTLKPNFCKTIDRFLGKRVSATISTAITEADYFLIFLSRHLIEKDKLWIDTVLNQKHIEHRLAIVLHGMTKEEFQSLPGENTNLKTFDNRVIVKPNVMNSSENLWNNVAKNVITMLLDSSNTSTNNSSTTITQKPGKYDL